MGRQSGRGRGSRSRGGKNSGGSNNNNSQKDKDEKKDGSSKDAGKSKDPIFSSPSSFMEAWDSSFFTAPAILLLTSLGFVVSYIPTLDGIPLGGRLRLCIQNWKRVCSNNWVLNVVSGGYKIPFKFIPFQRFWPKNPKISGPDYEMLVQEAADLLAKESIAPVEPVKGQFVSS